jgi:hypothetical protein
MKMWAYDRAACVKVVVVTSMACKKVKKARAWQCDVVFCHLHLLVCLR